MNQTQFYSRISPFSPPVTLLFILFSFSRCDACWQTEAKYDGVKYAGDQGANNPILRLKDRFADAISRAEKAVPRSQKYEILNSLRHRLQADEQDAHDPNRILELAGEFRRFRFYREAAQLYAAVAGNSTNDDLMLLKANRALGEIEFVANSDLRKAIDYFEKALSYAPKRSRIRGDLLGRLGSYYFVNEQVDEMLRVFKTFNDLPEKVKQSLPDSHLKANLYAGRFSPDRNLARKFIEQARKIVEEDPDAFPPDLVLSVSVEYGKGETWNSAERIKRLAALLEDQRFAKLPLIRRVAMEVFLGRFLESKQDWKQFEKATRDTLELLEGFESSFPDDRESIILGCQVLGIFAGAAKQQERRWNINKYRRDFVDKANRIQKQMRLYLPPGASKTDRGHIVESFSAGVDLLSRNAKTDDKKQFNQMKR